MELALCVIVFAQQIHSIAQLVQVDERTYENQAAQHVPAPEGAGAEAVSNTATAQLVTDTSGDPMTPYDSANAQGDGSDQEEQQAVVHGLLAVMTGSDQVDVGGKVGIENDGLEAEGDDAQQN